MKDILENNPFLQETSTSLTTEQSDSFDKTINPTFEFEIESSPIKLVSKDGETPTWE